MLGRVVSTPLPWSEARRSYMNGERDGLRRVITVETRFAAILYKLAEELLVSCMTLALLFGTDRGYSV